MRILKAFLAAIHLNEDGVVVAALPGKNLPVVEANGIGFQMPFADDRGVVASFLQRLGSCPLAGVKGVAVAHEAVFVAVLPGENVCARGAADGICTEGVGEHRALLRDAVNIRRWRNFG